MYGTLGSVWKSSEVLGVLGDPPEVLGIPESSWNSSEVPEGFLGIEGKRVSDLRRRPFGTPGFLGGSWGLPFYIIFRRFLGDVSRGEDTKLRNC